MAGSPGSGSRRPSRISQIFLQPLVTMGRRISGRKGAPEGDEALVDPLLEKTLKIPQDFISEMKEAFCYFDKVWYQQSLE